MISEKEIGKIYIKIWYISQTKLFHLFIYVYQFPGGGGGGGCVMIGGQDGWEWLGVGGLGGVGGRCWFTPRLCKQSNK